MLSKIEFYNCPDGSIAVKPLGEAMFIYDESRKDITEEMIVIIKDLYPEAFDTLSKVYSKSSMNRDFFQYRIVHRFIRCNFGEYDSLSLDIDKVGTFHFEDVRCPLKGECVYEGLICKPKLKSDLTPRELEVAEMIAEGMSRREIADELQISPFTVVRHINNIKMRLKLKSTNQIITYFNKKD